MFNWLNFCFVLLLVVAACGPNDEKGVEVLPADTIYNAAIRSFHKTQYKDAVQRLAEVRRLYPFTELAEKSLVLSAYVNFSMMDFDNAIIDSEGYIDSYPRGKYLEYVYYMRALSYYRQVVDTSRNLEYIEKSFDAFSEFLRSYPKGKYSDDVRAQLKSLKAKRALKELKIGLFYLRSGSYLAAIHRFDKVLNDYPDSPYVAECLYRMYEAFSALGIDKEQLKYKQAVLERFPDSVWGKKLQ